MKRILIVLLGVVSFSAVMAAKDLPCWQDPNVLDINRCPMTATFETGGNKLSLNGVWDFKWYEHMDMRSSDFYKAEYDATSWDTMPVPGLWELNGYGDPLYDTYFFTLI